MPELMDIVRRQIRVGGPITVAQYMDLCLAHPEFGYYRKQDPLGRSGDFTTAPEISQMFGELIGLWAVVVWQNMGAPAPCRLVEAGPGRGTLMADALRAAAQVPEFLQAIELHLMETSPVLRAKQQASLGEFQPVWHENAASLAEVPTIIIANEFLDALPIRQFQRSADGWHERLIGLDADERLHFVFSPPQLVNPLVPDSLKNAPINEIVEVCPLALQICRRFAEIISKAGGAAIFIDYGHPSTACGDTLQAVADHAFHDPLSDPGNADLTAHVDFGLLAATAKAMGTRVYGPISQGRFLRGLGIRQRAETLSNGASPIQRGEIDMAMDRLTNPDAMGELFKVLVISDPDMDTPPGFT